MKNKIIVISSYPEKNQTHGDKTVGGASYSKNLITNLKMFNKNLEIEVLAEIHDKSEKYIENGIVVNRAWKRSSPFSLIKLTDYILKNNCSNIVISFEFFMFGGIIENIIFLLMLLLFKIFGKKTTLIVHQVVTSLIAIYWPIIFLSEKVIVFEEKFKTALHDKKVIFIPHAVEGLKSRRKPIKNKFHSLYFGYISPYKGVDKLIQLWKKEYGQLTIAGGINPNHVKSLQHSKFVTNVIVNAKRNKIITSGFVPEVKIKYYFKNSDLVIFPYKMFFSSSGPLSLALSFEKPFILSRPLEGYFDSLDFQEALKKIGLNKEDFIFDFNQESFEKRLNWAKNNLDKLSNFSRIMKEKRDWKIVAKQYEKLLE